MDSYSSFFHLRNNKLWIVLGTIGLFFYILISAPPYNFPKNTIVTIPSGMDLFQASELLAQDHVVRYAFIFRSAAIILGGEKNLQAGDYELPYPENPYTLAWRMVHADYGIRTIRVTIPEGYTDKQISFLFDKTRFPLFDAGAFVRIAPQGYMFPDTYFVGVNATATSTIQLFRENFETQIDPLQDEIASSGYNENDVLTMASILEAEVPGDTDRKLVAGILWKRLKLGMLLQVDSAPETYQTAGLPATPIDNPGLDSIKAALNPTTSKYLYFLTDKKGVVHYAETFAEHEANIKKYL